MSDEPLKMIVTVDIARIKRAFADFGKTEVWIPDSPGIVIDHKTIAELERQILEVLAAYPVKVDPETGLKYHTNAAEMAYTFSRMYGKRWIRIVQGYL